MKSFIILFIIFLMIGIGMGVDGTYSLLDASSSTKYTKEYGTGTALDPFVPYHKMLSEDIVSLQSGMATSDKQDSILAKMPTLDDGKVPVVIDGSLTVSNLTIDDVNLSDATLAALESIGIGVSLPAGTNLLGKVGIDQTTPGTTNGVVVNSGTVSLSQTSTANDVDIASSLPVGSNAIGKLAANSGVDIGDVDVTSFVPGTGASSIGKAEDATHTSGDVGTLILAVRNDAKTSLVGSSGDYIPLMTNSTGALVTTTDIGTASSGAVTNAVLTDIHDNTNNSIRVIDIGASQSTIDSVMIAGAKTGVATNLTMDSSDNLKVVLPATDVNLGNVDLASAIPAGNNNMGDVDVASIATGTNTIGTVYPTAGNLPYGATLIDQHGASSANTAQTFTVAAVSGKQHRIFSYMVTVTGADVGANPITISFYDGTTGTTPVRVDTVAATAKVGSGVTYSSQLAAFTGTANTAMNIVVSAGGTSVVTNADFDGYTV